MRANIKKNHPKFEELWVSKTGMYMKEIKYCALS